MILIQAFITSFVVIAIWATMWDEAIFESIRHWGDKKLPAKLQKPIYDCPVCMIPYYGSAFYWYRYGVSVEDWLITIVVAMGINAVFVKLIPKEEIILKVPTPEENTESVDEQ